MQTEEVGVFFGQSSWEVVKIVGGKGLPTPGASMIGDSTQQARAFDRRPAAQ
jgi:hypothetical protein